MCVSKPYDHLSFKTKPELKAFWEVFDTTCSMGLCQCHPKLGEGEKTLKCSDIINVIVPHRTGDCILRSDMQINYNGCNKWLMINYKRILMISQELDLKQTCVHIWFFY